MAAKKKPAADEEVPTICLLAPMAGVSFSLQAGLELKCGREDDRFTLVEASRMCHRGTAEALNFEPLSLAEIEAKEEKALKAVEAARAKAAKAKAAKEAEAATEK